MEKFNQVKSVIAEIEADADKFYNKANNAAGTRVRKGMQELANLAKEIRKEIQETKNASTASAKAPAKKAPAKKK